MRNVPVALTPTESAEAAERKAILSTMVGEMVTLGYVKRDGTYSASTGEVVEFKGADGTDTMSVVVDCPDKGRRTINISRIHTINN